MARAGFEWDERPALPSGGTGKRHGLEFAWLDAGCCGHAFAHRRDA